MGIHHGKHHQAYVDNLNKALDGTEWADRSGRGGPRQRSTTCPRTSATAVRNNGGGHANHSLFWEIMGPDGGGEPEGDLAEAIDAAFGGFDELKEAINDGGRQALRQRLGLARLGRHRPRRHVDAEPGQPADGRRRRRSSASTSGSTPTT